MSGLYNLLNLGRSDDYEVNLTIYRIFKLFVMGGELSWVMNESACTKRVTPELASQLRRGQIVATVCVTQVFEQGPKFFSMKAREFEALEETDLTIPIADYKQPFPVVCFPIPEDYAKDRIVKMWNNKRIPKYAIIYQYPEMILVTIVYERDFVWSTFLVSQYEGHDFETKFESIQIGEHVRGSETDLDVIKRILRACLNGAMIFDQVKTTHFTVKGPKKDRKKDSVYYSFDQSVKLYSYEGGSGEETGEGTEKICHWRRGHWRNQAHGPRMSLRKPMRIAPVLVRRDKFAGELKDAQATYTN